MQDDVTVALIHSATELVSLTVTEEDEPLEFAALRLAAVAYLKRLFEEERCDT